MLYVFSTGNEWPVGASIASSTIIRGPGNFTRFVATFNSRVIIHAWLFAATSTSNAEDWSFRGISTRCWDARKVETRQKETFETWRKLQLSEVDFCVKVGGEQIKSSNAKSHGDRTRNLKKIDDLTFFLTLERTNVTFFYDCLKDTGIFVKLILISIFRNIVEYI